MERLTERLENGVINVKYASQHETAIHRLAAIEDILGDEYDLERLRELAQADREERVHIYGKSHKCPICGAYRLVPRVDGQFYFCFHCKNQVTRAEAEAALRRKDTDARENR